jgi:hypothetical protein
LIKFSKSQKIAKNNENPKNKFFNIFASFLAFLASSQKNLNFSRIFGTHLTFNALFLESPIFLIRVDVDKKN